MQPFVSSVIQLITSAWPLPVFPFEAHFHHEDLSWQGPHHLIMLESDFAEVSPSL